jgi:hypothetical protein
MKRKLKFQLITLQNNYLFHKVAIPHQLECEMKRKTLSIEFVQYLISFLSSF